MLAAALALSAVAASAASAQFTSTKTHTILDGIQENTHTFTADEGFFTIGCSFADFSVTDASLNDADVTIIPTYSSCRDSLGRPVDIDNTGFKYTFTRTGISGGNAIGSVHISGAMTLTITSGRSVVCTVHITVPQTTAGITYNNLGGTKGVTVEASATGVKNTTTGSFFNCGTPERCACRHHTGNTIVTGEDTSSNPAEIRVD